MFRIISLLALVMAVSACASRPSLHESITVQVYPELKLSEHSFEWDEDKSTALNLAHLGGEKSAFRDWDTPDGGQREVSSGGSFLRSAAMFWSTGGSVGMTAADQAATYGQQSRYSADPFGLVFIPADELEEHHAKYNDGGIRLVAKIARQDMLQSLAQYAPELDAEVFLVNGDIERHANAYIGGIQPYNLGVKASGSLCDVSDSHRADIHVSDSSFFTSKYFVPEGDSPVNAGDCLNLMNVASQGEVVLPGSNVSYHAFSLRFPYQVPFWMRELKAGAEKISWVISTGWRNGQVNTISKVPYARHGERRYFFTHDDSSEKVEGGLSPYILYESDPQFQNGGS